MSDNVIDLEVSRHPSGNYTLTRQDPGDRLPRDLEGEDLELLANYDATKFYRAVAAYMAKIVKAGERFTYEDVSDPQASN